MKIAQQLVGGLLAATAALCGCGMPGAPLPPSLQLPVPVTDLAATRTGNVVTLNWTMPVRNTDKLLLKEFVPVRICRQQGQSACVAVGAEQLFEPSKPATFSESLPPPLAAESPRLLTYFVELKNRNGRSAGLSNAAEILAGQPPPQVTGLTAEIRKDGVALHWTPVDAALPAAARIVVRLHRTLLTPAKQDKPEGRTGLMAPPHEPLERTLLVEPVAPGQRPPHAALDKEIRFGQSYEYRAQRIAVASIDGRTVELAGELSPPVTVEAKDTFPPAEPRGLAAVASAGDAATPPSIDLSWQPDTDIDLAGYVVYRKEASEPSAAWQRISGGLPVFGPAFHDDHVRPGQTYRYRVTAIDAAGHESAPSAEAAETVPSP